MEPRCDGATLHGFRSALSAFFGTYPLFVIGMIPRLRFWKSAYHVLKAHSERVAQSVLKLDYLGIVLNIAIISITSTWSGLRQQPHLQASYITSSVGLSGIVFFVLLSPKADGAAAALWRYVYLFPASRTFRALTRYNAQSDALRGIRREWIRSDRS